jgi:hypothetical protein
MEHNSYDSKRRRTDNSLILEIILQEEINLSIGMFDFVLAEKLLLEFYYRLIHNMKSYEQESAFQISKAI